MLRLYRAIRRENGRDAAARRLYALCEDEFCEESCCAGAGLAVLRKIGINQDALLPAPPFLEGAEEHCQSCHYASTTSRSPSSHHLR